MKGLFVLTFQAPTAFDLVDTTYLQNRGFTVEDDASHAPEDAHLKCLHLLLSLKNGFSFRSLQVLSLATGARCYFTMRALGRCMQRTDL